MKTNKKYLVAAIMLTMGIVVFLAGFAVAGFDLKNIGTESPYEERYFTADGDVDFIWIKDSNMPIEFRSSDDDQIHILYFENEETRYTIDSENGSLKMRKNTNRKWFHWFFTIDFASWDTKVVVSIPRSYRGTIEVTTSNGRVEFSDIRTEQLTAGTSNARIELRDVGITGDLKLENSNGSVLVNGVSVERDFFAQTSNARISVDKTEIGGNGVCRTSNGVIRVADSTAQSFDLDTNNGQIDLERMSAASDLSAETSNSDIQLTEADVGRSITCISSNGDIKGSIVGKMEDFSITSDTSNGKNNLPTHTDSGAKEADIRTSNASINIDFVK